MASVRAGLSVSLTALALAGCAGDDAPDEPLSPREPSLIVTGEKRAELRERLEREPYAAIVATIEERAARPYEEPDRSVWDHRSIGHNNQVAQANAFLAWLHDDREAARKAVDFMLRMPTDFENNDTWDVNIRMPRVLMTYCYAWDFLRATSHLSRAEAEEMRRRVLHVTDMFFTEYLDNALTRQGVLGFAQNNHPIRTAAAVGMVAITFPDHPEADRWASWAVSELDYLMGPDGQYLQPDGGVSEGPFYYTFAYGPAVALFIAMDHAVEPKRTFHRDCRNRQDVEPWAGHGCVDGEPFTFENPLRSDLLHATLDWSIDLRTPAGWRAPLADANFIHHNGGALLTSYGGAPHLMWDWESRPEWDRHMTFGMDLTIHHLAYLDDSVQAEPPPWKNSFMPDAGHAVFRSGWETDARWLLLVGENGAARKTLHDHVDGTSFSLAAYGEYLLVDPGYYKPDELDNALTAPGEAHNTILINGSGAPEKGLLHDFGDADAFIENTVDGAELAYAEARQSYRKTRIERSAVFVRDRYFVIADRLDTEATAPREHAWRLGGWAGYDVGGTFEPWACDADPCGAKWEREKAGVEVHLASTASGLAVREPEHDPLTAPHVGAFDVERNVEDHGVIDGAVTAVEPGYLAVLAPYRVDGAGDDAPLTVSALDAGGDASAWLVEGEDGSEVAWLREPGAATTLAVEGSTLVTDAELTVLSLDGAFGLVARGSEASVDGQAVVSGSGPVVSSESP